MDDETPRSALEEVPVSRVPLGYELTYLGSVPRLLVDIRHIQPEDRQT